MLVHYLPQRRKKKENRQCDCQNSVSGYVDFLEKRFDIEKLSDLERVNRCKDMILEAEDRVERIKAQTDSR